MCSSEANPDVLLLHKPAMPYDVPVLVNMVGGGTDYA